MRIFAALAITLLFVASAMAQTKEAIIKYNEGLKYFNEGNYKNAIPFMEQSVEIDPNFTPPLQCLAYSYQEIGEKEKAIATYSRLQEKTPYDEKVLYNLALLHYENGNHIESKNLAEKILKSNPNHKKAATLRAKLAQKVAPEELVEDDKYNYALALYKKEQYKECIEALEELGEKSADICYLRGISYKKIEDEDSALKYLTIAANLDPKHEEANFQLGILAYNLGDFKLAEEAFERSVRLSPSNIDASYFLGMTLYQLDKFDEAERYLRDAYLGMPGNEEVKSFYEKVKNKNASKSDAIEKESKSDKPSPEAVKAINLGVEAFQKKDYQTAQSHFQKAVELSPNNAQCHYYNAVALKEVGKVVKAKHHYEKALQLSPNLGKCYSGIGLIHFENMEYVPASVNYEKAVELGEEDFVTYYNMAISFYRVQNYEKAALYFERAVNINPKDMDARFNLAMSIMWQKRYLEAIDHFDVVIANDPDWLDAYYHKSLCLIETNEYEQAIAISEKVIKSNENYPYCYLSMAIALQRMGEHHKAEQYQIKAYRLDPRLKKGF